MKRSAKPLSPQMNLPLLEAPTTAPGDKQKELALTLMEMPINAALENELLRRARGGEDEPAEAQRLFEKVAIRFDRAEPITSVILERGKPLSDGSH